MSGLGMSDDGLEHLVNTVVGYERAAEAAAARISRLKAVVEGQLRLLGKLEWSCFGMGDSVAMCPVCMASTGERHSLGCALAAALAEAKEVLAEK